MIKTQFGKKIKIIRSNNGSEFISGPMLQYYVENRIIHQTRCVVTPQQNDRVERKHRDVLNVARHCVFKLPVHFGGECLLTTTSLIKRTPSKLLNGKTSYEMIYHKKNII